MERSTDGQGFVSLFHWFEDITYHESEGQLQYLLRFISVIYLDCFHPHVFISRFFGDIQLILNAILRRRRQYHYCPPIND